MSTTSTNGTHTHSFTPTAPELRVVFSASSPFSLAGISLLGQHTDTIIKELPTRLAYRYGFNGEEIVDEVSGEGNSYDYGNRFYNPRIGKFFSIDAYASKYPAISPYAFALNSPIRARDVGGDSVLFFAQSGAYLGFSNDNQRYEDKNLIVIISDHAVENFQNQYNIKRYKNTYTSDVAREANVAGLEAMGTTIDVTSMVNFYNKYVNKITDPKTGILVDAPKVAFGQHEWGAWMKHTTNPYDKTLKNWIVLDESTKVEGTMTVVIPSAQPSDVAGWFHTHTSDSKSDGFSSGSGDMHTMRSNSLRGSISLFGLVSLNNSNQIQISLLQYFPKTDKVKWGQAITTDSFKNKPLE